MKIILKKFLIIWLIICMLLPTLFSGVALAADEGTLNVERAGNFVGNFAINFYENWSSESVVEGKSNTNSGINVTGEYGWPLTDTGITLTSNFSDIDIGIRNDSAHNGLDMAPTGNVERDISVYSVCEGKITDAKFNNDYNGGMGNYVQIQQGDIKIRYLHLSEVADEILNNIGSTLSAGAYLGKMGNTGLSTGKHLHIDFSVQDETLAKSLTQSSGTAYFPYYYSNGGFAGYFMDPLGFISQDGISSSTTSKPTAIIRGQVNTEYDAEIDPKAEVTESSTSKYKFNNISWIGFVYRNALYKNNSEFSIDTILSGSGKNININTSTFDDKNNISGVKELAETSDVLDISRLISEGKILPGDILYAEHGDEAATKEYLLYVGGTKVIYATQDPTAAPSGALKYEYIDYYLQRIKRKLLEENVEQADSEDFIMPKYGITQVYRINSETANSIKESNANLFFNGKGYYSYTQYKGIPEVSYEGETTISPIMWIFDTIGKLAEFIINLIVYMVRMQVIGWANLVENLIQSVVLGVSGHSDGPSIDAIFGINQSSASGDRITVESIFFNKIPILDANFFNFESAGGYSLKVETEVAGPTLPGEESVTTTVIDENNVVYKLRRTLQTWYVIIRNLSIAILLFVLIYLGIRLAITASSEKKAECKKLLVSWVVGMCIIVFVHLFMYMVFMVNDTLVNICKGFGENAATQEVSELIENTQSQEELNLYDAIRTKAYAFSWKEGLPATIIYIFLIYLLIRFLLIYLKRYLTIYILALSGSFMGVKYAFEKIAGKKTTSLNKWLKDFSFNVLLQTVHAFLYVLFMAIALSISQTNLAGAAICLVILNFMLQADKIIIKIFGLNKADSLAEVNNPESWGQLFHKFLPIYTIGTQAFNLSKNWLFGDRGLISEIRYMSTDKDNIKDAQKVLESRKYERIGNRWRALDKLGNKISSNKIGGKVAYVVNKTPIKNLWKYAKYKKMLGNNLSADTNKKYYAAIKQAKKLERAKFTRKVSTLKDFVTGAAGMLASVAVAIDSPTAGIALFTKSKRTIDKHRTMSRLKRKSNTYGLSKDKAKLDKIKAKKEYNNLLDKHANKEIAYQEKRDLLKDDWTKAAAGSADKTRIANEIKKLEEDRKIEKSKELHMLQEAYENMNEANISYENAKHERGFINNALKMVGTGIGASVVADIAANDAKATYKAQEDANKQQSKLDDLEKIAQLETELRKLNRELKVEQKRYATDKGMSEEDSKKMLEEELDATVKEAKEMNIRASYIKEAVSSYLFENNVDKITGDDVGGVLDKLQIMLAQSGKNIKFTDEVKKKVKKQLEEKMLKDSKGLGFDTKDATTTIRTALGKDGVLKPSSTATIEDDKVRKKHEQIQQKIKEINTYDEVGKVKYKQSLINMKKILKDAKKQ